MADGAIPEHWGRHPVGEYAFPGPLRDQLVAAILTGAKTSTSSLALEYERHGEPLPRVGDREVVVDSDGQPVCLTEVTGVSLVPAADVSSEHAQCEGEGYASVAEWRAGHEQFWHSDDFRASVAEPGLTVTDSTLVVCVRFRVLERAV